MKYSKIIMSELKTWGQCQEAIDQIEGDWRNSQGGWDSWTSGYETYLLVSAQNKIDQIGRKQDRLNHPCDDYEDVPTEAEMARCEARGEPYCSKD